jgi:hypothetical protein
MVKPNMPNGCCHGLRLFKMAIGSPIVTKVSDELVAPLAPFFCTYAKHMALHYQSFVCATYASRPKCKFEKKKNPPAKALSFGQYPTLPTFGKIETYSASSFPHASQVENHSKKPIPQEPSWRLAEFRHFE